MASSPSVVSGSFSPLGPPRGGPTGIFSFNSMPSLLHLGISTIPGGLGVECLQPSLDVSGKLCVFSSWISSSGSVNVSDRTCQRSTQMVDSGGTMFDGGSLAPHTSQDVGRHSLVVPHHKRSHHGYLGRAGTQGSAISDLALWLLSNVCYADKGSLPQSVRQWWQQLQCLCQKSTSSVGMNGQGGVLDRVYQTMPFLCRFIILLVYI